MNFLPQEYTLTGHEIAGWISVLLIFFSTAIYIRAIITHKTLPNIVWWWLYELSTLAVLLSSWELGSMSTILASGAYAISQFLTIILALKYGFSKIHKTDFIYFGISFVSLSIWGLFALKPELSDALGLAPHMVAVIVLGTNTLVDLMGAVSIFTKLYLIPESEDASAWFVAFLSGFFSLLAVETYTFHDLVYPVYLFISNLAIWLLCFRRKPQFRFRIFFKSLIGRIIPTNR